MLTFLSENIFHFKVMLIVSVSTHIIRTVYEILKHRQKLKANKLTFAIVFTNMMLLWMSWFSLCILDTNKIEIPLIIRLSGITLVAAGIIVFLTALFTIKTLESYEGELISKGIYSKIRHPMYLGFILWLIGFPLFAGAITSFFLAIIFIGNVLFWRHLEELELIKRFPTYSEYRKTTIF